LALGEREEHVAAVKRMKIEVKEMMRSLISDAFQ
jgi:hypothetical protein